LKRLIIGISGASGAPLAVAMLRALKAYPECETHLVMTDGAKYTIKSETNLQIEEVEQLADQVYDCRDIGASIASGSFETDGMVIIPCSMKTLAGISSGYADNLLLRAADVMLKERRKLVLLTRETPLNLIHLRNMQTVLEAGAVIMPPVLTYYHNPKSIEEMQHQIIGKVFAQFGLHYKDYMHWDGGINL
jgi:4-hydroxy-3-polyprenylbenzoate decarboxylase